MIYSAVISFLFFFLLLVLFIAALFVCLFVLLSLSLSVCVCVAWGIMCLFFHYFCRFSYVGNERQRKRGSCLQGRKEGRKSARAETCIHYRETYKTRKGRGEGNDDGGEGEATVVVPHSCQAP
ncbi:hypothetical protein TCDM_03659 [Trypanosoma cruzi Dm28c]|uniref:Uncharacterized protein n=1 Tax=Trypanosoma cruzi Dm28c TaxID=1416333 RepID=V5BST6_TRYCR|nr:hypothetical protein TCDM_03659 [Trypanosoma cruzi Dm28c]